MDKQQREELYKLIGLGGLKYYLLKVEPRKRMLFNPEESIELNGNTGPFIQYAHARIKSLLGKGDAPRELTTCDLQPEEKEIIKQLVLFPETIEEAANGYAPSLIANYTYELVKLYNHFYQSISIHNEEDEVLKNMRKVLSTNVAKTINLAMRLLGITVPERM